MPIYTVQVVVELWAESPYECLRYIKRATDRARDVEIVYQEATILDAKPDEPESEAK